MKARNVLLGALLGAIALFPACSSNSPTAPPPSPTPVAYSIALTASPSEALVGQAIVLSARVTSGGNTVPDGTTVTFTVSGCVPSATGYPYFFLGNDVVGTCEQVRTTVNGVATATLYSQADGIFEVVARVPGVQAKINLRWLQPINPNTLAIYQVVPQRGRPEGGEQVRILGRSFAKPVTVDFVVGANSAHAQVLDVNASGTEILSVTPPVPATVTGEVVADVRVCAAVGTTSQVCDTLRAGFTYERPFAEPRIYSVEPGRGSYAGGEQVTIFGANFFATVRVFFGRTGNQEEAQVASVSADNARITVFTPRHPGAHLEEELVVDVSVTTRDGTLQEQRVTLANAYTYVPDTGVPLLYSVIPSRGSPRGGETVVLSGKNFTQPVNVEFIIGAPVNTTLPAAVQNVNAAGTQMIITTPQASPDPLPDDALVDIRITNRVGAAGSQSATFADVFTYSKEAREIDIYAVIPNRGRAIGGERVVIAGRGFVQPVKVEFIVLNDPRTAEVVSVNDGGSTIVVLTPAVPQAVTTEVVADVRVTAALGTTVEKTATLPEAYTYERQFGEPRIYGVVPNRGSYDGGDVVTILGANFHPPLRVTFAAELAVVRSSTESEIVVETPRHNGAFITEELVVPVAVATRYDTLLQQTVTKADAYTYLPNTGVPQLYSVQPSRGSPRGGELVTLIGRNFHRPVTVDFTFNPTLPAEVVSVNDEATEMVVRTPEASPEPLPEDTSVTITITNLVGTAASQSATFDGVFTFESEAKDVVIYSIVPNRGTSEGGDTVTIFGSGFVSPVQVDFVVGGASLSAQVLSVAGGQIVAKTPAVPGQTTDEATADVRVTTAFGEPTQKQATLAGGFTFEKPFPAPQIYMITPKAIVENSPPYPVTIFGANFFEPVRVKLGDEDAQVQSVSADHATISILTPLHSGRSQDPVPVDVTVFTRFETQQQQQATRAGGFTWLPSIVEAGAPVIYSVNPNRGSRVGGEPVTILGENLCTLQATATGLECVTPPAVSFLIGAPLNVDRAARVVSYTPDGRRVDILTPAASPEPLLQDVFATVRVTNNTGFGELVNGFVYERDTVELSIYSVVPNRGRPEGGQTVTIFGGGFEEPVKVNFLVEGSPRAASVQDVNDDGTQIVVTTPATGVDATVEHVADIEVTVAVGTANERSDTLSNAFTYEKQFTGPQIFAIVPDTGSIQGGEQVIIYGANFFQPVKVTFTNATYGPEDAKVLSVTTDQLVVETPEHPNTTINADLPNDVTVITRLDTAQQQSVTRTGGFTYLADFGIPLLYSVTPNRGRARGDQDLTLVGRNLQGADVTFRLGPPLSIDRPAQVSSINAAGTVLHLTTPAASSDFITSDIVVDFIITTPAGSATFEDVFTYERESALAIYSVVPNRGRPEGDETVTILGRGFVQPVTVDFIVEGTARHAQVLSVNDTGTEITVTTPATGVDANVEHVADIVVTAAEGTANEATDRLLAAFTYERRIPAPLIYAVVPNRGGWAGGETVQVFGANFVQPVRVQLGDEDAQVVSVAANGSQISVLTPLHPNTHLSQELVVDVTVYTSFETAQEQQATLAGGFTWVPDTGVPLLYTVNPARGNPRGGDTVLLAGKNFTEPVTVEFLLGAPYNSTLPASVVDVNDSGTVITLLTPQASPTPVTQEVVVAIRITNLVGSAFSQTATFQGVFTYDSESNLAIYSVQPNRGSAGGLEPVQIFGRGFIEPINVDFIVAGQVRHAEVVDVDDAGTVIDILTPPSGLDATVERIADVQVTAAAGTANQISDTLPAAFTYEKFFAAPSIYAVIPDRGAWSGNEVVTIVGANFFTPYRVFFGEEEATVDTAASSTSSLVVRTPQHPQSHLTSDLTVNVRVVTRFDTAQEQEVVLPNGFTWKPDTGVPLLYSVVSNRGNPRGGETVTLTGKNFTQPVTVEFIIGPPVNVTYPVTVLTVDPAGGVMTIKTPQASPSPLTQEVEVDIRITNLVGSPSSLTATFLKAFTYTSESDLAIYTVSPNRGSPAGGQDVEIRGRGFTQPVNVHFIVAGAERQAQVVAVLDGGSRIQVKTPASNVDASIEHVADVRVTVAAGTANQRNATLPASYTYEKQFPAPAIYAVVPNRGAHAGNETVTIFGANFFTPVRIRFGNEDVALDPAATQTTSQLVVKTPIHNPSHLTEDLTVNVTVITKFETAQQQQVVLPGGFTWIPDTGVPILYSVVPSKGSPRGGETVVLTGKNFTAPVNVEFLLGAPLNTTLPATILDVNAAGTQITIKTPQASPTPVVTDVLTDIRITNLIGSANSKTATFNDVFVYEGESRPPVVYFVLPAQGSPRGGESVTIFGRFFLEPVRVRFSFTANGAAKQVDAEVVDVSIDGTQIIILTPPAAQQPLESDAPVDITVTTEYGTGRDKQATLEDGFLYIAEHPTPELFALTPNSGPIEGGTRITITGAGFQYPVQVVFTIPVYGAVQAQVVSVNFNQVVVVSPSITPMEPDTPTIAQVKAINMETGKISNELPFRYGNAMFISAIAPSVGPDIGGTMVTIFGQGFVAPVTVELAGVPAQVLTVAGTEIVVRSTAPIERACEPTTGPVEVTNIDSNLSATGPSFTYLPAQPLITSVEVELLGVPQGDNVVDQVVPGGPGACATNPAYSSYTVVVRGENFETYPGTDISAMSVIFENPPVEVLATCTPGSCDTEISFTLPDLSRVVLDQAACTTGGIAGLRDIPTGIAFTVKNNNNGCTDSLSPALILNPCDTTCRLGAVAIIISPTSQPLNVGDVATFTVSINPGQPGPITLPLSITGPGGVITINGTATTADDTVTIPALPATPSDTFTVEGISGGTVTITATLPLSLGGASATTTVSVGGLTVTLTPPSANIQISDVVNFQATLSSAAGSAFNATISVTGNTGAISIAESSGVPNDNILAFSIGDLSKTFTVTGVSSGLANVTVTLDVLVGGAFDTSPVSVSQYNISLTPSVMTVAVGGNGQFTLTLNAPAIDPPGPATGVTVYLTQEGPAGVLQINPEVSLPDRVVINAGNTSETFTVTGLSQGGPVTVIATLDAAFGGGSDSAVVTVLPLTIAITPTSLPLVVGSTGTFLATLSSDPGANLDVPLTVVGNAALIDVDETSNVADDSILRFGVGNTSELFTVDALGVGGPVTVIATLPASVGGGSASTAITITGLTLTANPTALTIPLGGSANFTLLINAPAPPPGIDFTFTVANPSVASVTHPTPDVAAGSSTSVPIAVDGDALGATTVTAQLPALLGGAAVQIPVTVVQGLTLTPSALTVPVGGIGQFTVTMASAASANVTVGLSYAGTPATAITGPPSVVILAGATSANFQVTGVLPTVTPITITAELPSTGLPPGLAGASASAQVTVTGQALQFTLNPTSMTMPAGTSVDVTVQLNQPAPLGGYTMNITQSGAPGVIGFSEPPAAPPGTATETLTIAATGTQGVFRVHGLANGGPVQILVQGTTLGNFSATASATVAPATATLTLNPSPLAWWVGDAGDPLMTLGISPTQPTPAGGTPITLATTNPLVVAPPASDTIVASASTETFTAVVGAVGTATITATLPAYLGGGTATSAVTVFDVTFTGTTIYAGTTDNKFINISPTLPFGITITLSDTVGGLTSFPASVFIPAATAQVAIPITGVSVGAETFDITFPAEVGGDTIVGAFSITVLDLPLDLTPEAPVTVYRGTTLTMTAAIPVTRNADTLVSLNLGGASTGSATFPASVTIPAGSLSTTFTVVPTAAGTAIINGDLPVALNNNATPHDTETLTIANMTLALTPDPMNLFPSQVGTMTAAIPAARTVDTLVTLTNNGGVGEFAIPPSVTIPAGLTAATFNVTALATTGTGSVDGDLPAGLSALVVDDSATVNVVALTLSMSPPAVGDLMAGGGQQFTVTIDAALSQDIPVTLASSDPGLVSVPASVVIPAGSTSASFVAIAESTTDSGPAGAIITATLPASVGGASDTSSITGVDPLTIAAAPTNVSIPAATEEEVIVTAGTTLYKNVSVTIASANPVLVGIFDNASNPTGTLQLLAGGNSGTFRVRGLGIGTGVGVRLDTPAAFGGTGSAEADVTVNVLALQLRFNVAIFSVNHGGNSASGALDVRITDNGGSPVLAAVPVTVNLTSADPTMVQLGPNGFVGPGTSPVQAIIPAGSSFVEFGVFGNSPGGPITVQGQLLPSVGGATATLQVGVANITTAWTFSIAPTEGCTTGGTAVTVTAGGTGAFWNNVQVTFDGVAATVVSQTPTVLVVSTPPHATGTVDVRVTNPSVPESVTNTGDFTYFGTFTVSNVISDIFGSPDPSAGPTSGGTTFSFTGSGFVPGFTYNVDIGGFAYTATAVSATVMTMDTSDSGYPIAGPVTVTIDDGVGCGSVTLPGGITYYDPPLLGSVSPTQGPAAGGNTVTITGIGFLPGGIYLVSFDSNLASNVVAVNPTTITCTAPPNATSDTVDVFVMDAVFQNDTLFNVYDYYAPPTITSLTLTSGSISGGTNADVNGTFLAGATYTVDFGGSSIACADTGAGTQLNCLGTPAHAVGPVTVTATDAIGQSGSLANAFTYNATLTMSSVTSINTPTGSSVTSAPAGINCTEPTAGACSFAFSTSPVLLTPSLAGADTGWTWGGAGCGGCAANTSCSVALAADPTFCTLTFN